MAFLKDTNVLCTTAQAWAKYVFSPAVWAGVSVALAIALYYSWSWAGELQQLGRTLRRELQSDRQELRQLQRECVKFIKAD